MSSLDRALVHRLANIKSTHERASDLLVRPTTPDVGIGLVLLDVTLEAIFKLAIDKRDYDIGSRWNGRIYFPDLVNEMNAIPGLEDVSKLKPSLLSLHQARNGFQHNGVIPDISGVLGEYLPLADRVMRIISQNSFGIAWDDVSTSLLIKNEQIRSLYHNAERAFSQKDWALCASFLIYTFEAMKAVAQQRIYGSGISLFRLGSSKPHADQATWDYVSTLDQELETFKLGIEYLDLRNYLDVAQNVGIGSILDGIESKSEKTIIQDFVAKLQKIYGIGGGPFLAEWCSRMRYPILKFITKTETDERFSAAFISEAIRKILLKE
jgi:hypothetical protein